jgi:hypothetical protein
VFDPLPMQMSSHVLASCYNPFRDMPVQVPVIRHYGLYAVSAKVTTGLYMVNITVSGVHKLSKVEKPLQIPGARRVACSKFCTDDPQILGATVQNLVVTATWRQEFLLPRTTDCHRFANH